VGTESTVEIKFDGSTVIPIHKYCDFISNELIKSRSGIGLQVRGEYDPNNKVLKL
jgi:hypothetical protein